MALLGCSRNKETDAPATHQSEAAKPTEATRSAPISQATPQPPRAELRFAADGLSTTAPGVEVVVLAGGCFWGMEDILREVEGVVDTEVGYAGGTTEAPNYDDVKGGDSGHAESVRVVFAPDVISFRALLLDWFFKMHDPTTQDRQGNDRGSQYRSAIFTTSEAQRQTAAEVLRTVDRAGVWGAPVVTQVHSIERFTPAEDFHQNYLQKHPSGYTCHYVRDFTL